MAKNRSIKKNKHKIKHKNRKLQTKKLLNNLSNSFNPIITIKQPWFNYIQSGVKTVEGRLNKGQFAKFGVGSQITWKNPEKLFCRVKITKITKYPSFKELLEKEGITRVLPNIADIPKGISIYRQYYTKKDEDKYGVVAIEMEPMNYSIHEGKLQSPYYEYIRDGVKIFEMRVNDEKRKKMQVGDIWNFTHNSLPITETPKYSTKIIEKKLYNSFEDAIIETGYNRLLPNATSNEEAIKIYNAFGDGAYEREAKQYGVVRFTLQFISLI